MRQEFSRNLTTFPGITISGKNQTIIDFDYLHLFNEYRKFAEALNEGQALLDRQRDNAFKAKLIIFLLPFIIFFGIIGNILNIFIFSRKTLKSNSTFRFLLYLSVFDLLVLLVCAPDAFLRFGYQIHIRQLSIYTCRLHTFFTYLFTHASSSILMMISIDRALIISNKSFHFALLRLRKYENIKKESHSYLFGPSICCILQCGFTSKMKKIHPSSMHRTDLIMIFLLVILVAVNSHYMLFMRISSPAHMGDSAVNMSSLFLYDVNLTNRYYMNKQKQNFQFEVCFPLEGNFLAKAIFFCM